MRDILETYEFQKFCIYPLVEAQQIYDIIRKFNFMKLEFFFHDQITDNADTELFI